MTENMSAMKNADYVKSKFIQWLLCGNTGFKKHRDTIAVEVLFSPNHRKADMLVLSNSLHAFEIKGDRDNLRKLRYQLRDYSKTFDRVSVVTTQRHLKDVKKIIGRKVGLILFTGETFLIKRKAIVYHRLDKASLLTFLDKNTVKSLLKHNVPAKASTDEIREMAANQLTYARIQEAVRILLKKRYRKLFQLFLKDIGGTIMPDDLAGLRGKINTLSA
jgi:hypothetical protein